MAAEKNFENKIKSYLKDQGAWFIKYWAGAQFTKSGIPDILSCFNGYFVAIELKGPNGKATKLQWHNIEKINQANGYAIVLYPKDFQLFKNLIVNLKVGDLTMARHLVRVINAKEREII